MQSASQSEDAIQAVKALETLRTALLVSFRSQTLWPIPRASTVSDQTNDEVATQSYSRARQQRIELMLRAMEVARRRNSDSENTEVPLPECPCVRSFVEGLEAIVTSTIPSVESRTY